MLNVAKKTCLNMKLLFCFPPKYNNFTKLNYRRKRKATSKRLTFFEIFQELLFFPLAVKNA